MLFGSEGSEKPTRLSMNVELVDSEVAVETELVLDRVRVSVQMRHDASTRVLGHFFLKEVRLAFQ